MSCREADSLPHGPAGDAYLWTGEGLEEQEMGGRAGFLRCADFDAG
jgi:hypothetical protein